MPSPFHEEKKSRSQSKERSRSQENKITSSRLRCSQLMSKNDTKKIGKFHTELIPRNNLQLEEGDIKERTTITKRKQNRQVNSRSLSMTIALPSVFTKQKRSSENRFGGV